MSIKLRDVDLVVGEIYFYRTKTASDDRLPITPLGKEAREGFNSQITANATAGPDDAAKQRQMLSEPCPKAPVPETKSEEQILGKEAREGGLQQQWRCFAAIIQFNVSKRSLEVRSDCGCGRTGAGAA